ncbi:MAG: ABC-F family ATP-binding cassette domain-containing protein [Paracoccaceae bacterium]
MARPPILTLSDISLTFGGNPLFSGASAIVHQGDRIGLVGRNGSGKSTLLRIMAGLVEPDGGERFARARTSIAYMEQTPDFRPFSTLDEYVASGLGEPAPHLVAMAMEGLKLRPGIRPSDASGGEKRRAALARMLVADPDLMLLDEPTNHLDIEAITWLEEYLRAFAGTFVMVSHDRMLLRNLTSAMLWVDRGQVRRLNRGFAHFEDWRDKVFEEEDLARHKLDRLIQSEGRWAVEGISARRKRNMGRVRRLQELRAARAAEIRRAGTAKMALESGEKSGRLVVEAKGISKSLGGKPLVRDFSVRIARGERVAIVGPNGIGKTTLVRLLTGRLAPDGGTVRSGSNLVAACLDQNRSQLVPGASLWDTLANDAALGVSGRNDQIMVRGRPRHVMGYLKDFLFTEEQAHGPVSALSGGEKARLLLARIMARDSNLLVLDEPTNDLDIETLDLLQELVADYDGTVILVSHDRDFLDRIATTTILMEGRGRAVIYAGGYSDMLAQRGAGPETAQAARARSKPKERKSRAAERKAPAGLTFTQRHRLRELPGEIAELEAKVAKLRDLLGDPGLFDRDRPRFDKASAELATLQDRLHTAEEEWLRLAALEEGAQDRG